MLKAAALRPSRLSTLFLILLVTALSAACLTGFLLWWAARLSGNQESPYWVHPCRVLHGVLNPVLCGLFGFLWARHIPAGWRLRANRRSGAAMVLVLAGLIATGVLLYYAGGERLRAFGSSAHELLGLALPVLLGLHWAAARGWVRRGGARPSGEEHTSAKGGEIEGKNQD